MNSDLHETLKNIVKAGRDDKYVINPYAYALGVVESIINHSSDEVQQMFINELATTVGDNN